MHLPSTTGPRFSFLPFKDVDGSLELSVGHRSLAPRRHTRNSEHQMPTVPRACGSGDAEADNFAEDHYLDTDVKDFRHHLEILAQMYEAVLFRDGRNSGFNSEKDDETLSNCSETRKASSQMSTHKDGSFTGLLPENHQGQLRSLTADSCYNSGGDQEISDGSPCKVTVSLGARCSTLNSVFDDADTVERGDLSRMSGTGSAVVMSICVGRHENFKKWPEWDETKEIKSKPVKVAQSRRVHTTTMTLHHSQASFLTRYMIKPGGKTRLSWDLCGCILLLYDVVTLPFFAAFDVDESLLIKGLGMFTLMYWTADVVLSFLTGYFDNGTLIMIPSQVARNYMRTWFVPDLIILVIDWTTRFFEADSTKLVRTMRGVIRYGRALRLLRILKLKRVINELQDRLHNEHLSIFMDVSTYICILFGCSHVVACVWYGVGRMGMDSSEGSWLVHYGMMERSIAFRYFTSLHFSLAFFAASCDIFAISTQERLMTVICIVVALVGFSSFISIITSAVMTMVNMRNETRRQFWLLRRFLRAKAISKALALRVERYLDYITEMDRKHVRDSQVHLLMRLSEPLREELRFEAFYVHLKPHPLFAALHAEVKVFIKACNVLTIGRSDLLFSRGQVAEKMIIVTSGEMVYHRFRSGTEFAAEASGPEASASAIPRVSQMKHIGTCMTVDSVDHGEKEDISIRADEWVAEVVLWMPWTHLGTFVCNHASQLTSIDSASVREMVCKQEELWTRMRKYADAFVRLSNRLHNEEISDLLDREITEYEEYEHAVHSATLQHDAFHLFKPHPSQNKIFKAGTMAWKRMVSKTKVRLSIRAPKRNKFVKIFDKLWQ